MNERNEIAVTNNGNNRAQLFSSDGTYLRSLGREDTKQGGFDYATRNTFVVDSCNHLVQLFYELAEYLNQSDEQGNLDDQFDSPRGLSLNTLSKIHFFFADSGNNEKNIFSNSCHCFYLKLGDMILFPFPFIALLVKDSGEHCIKVLLLGMWEFSV